MNKIKCMDFLVKHGLIEENMDGDILGVNPLDFVNEYEIREKFRENYGFAVITERVIKVIRKYDPILEIGAGAGYWAYELSRNGVDIIATDLHDSKWFKNWGWDNKSSWVAVKKWEASAAVKKYPGRNLLTVWPALGADWSADAVEKFKGEIVIYCGEGKGGCTGNDRFHEILETKFNELEIVNIPRFSGLHDSLFVYQRKEGH